jgi:2-keto-4-pentenoate hydratase
MPTPPTSVAVANGMRALLARRTEELAGGAAAVGWKIGCNAKGLQDHFGLRGPVVGYLTDATVMQAGVDVDLSGWLQPALEVEVAIRVGDDGGVSALAPALELVDLDQPFDRIETILAQNIFHRAVVFGPQIAAVAIDDLAVAVSRDGSPVADGPLVDAPDDTIDTVRTFLEAHGEELLPGHRIIAGSLIAPLTVAAGERLEISFGVLGSLAVSFC